jgi:hypothetical protein
LKRTSIKKLICSSLAAVLAGFFLISPLADAHPNGTSKVIINLFPGDRIEFTADVNSDDILNLVLTKEDWEDYWKKAPAYNERMAYYIENHTSLEVDGRLLKNGRVIQWYQGAPDSVTKMDSAAIKESTFILKFAWPLSKTAARLNFSSVMFAEFELDAICHVKFVFLGDTVKSKVLLFDTWTGITLDRDSLTALVKRLKTPASAPKAPSSAIRNIALGLGLAAVAITLLLLRRKTRQK